MRYIFIILLSLIVFSTWGQCPSDSLTKRPSLYDITNKGSIERLAGDFHFSDRNGFFGYAYTLNDDNTFRMTETGCSGRIVWDSGLYKFNPPHQIVFLSKKGCLLYDIYQFADYVFLVKPAEKEQLLVEFDKVAKVFSKKSSYKMGEDVFTSTQMIAYAFLQSYFTKGLE